jgi:predicted TIM-barrel fold metal-dependent hydrolase
VEAGQVIDACAFHDWASKRELGPYLPRGWRELLVDRAEIGGTLRARSLYQNPMGAKDPDAYPEQGPAGSDPDLLIRQLLADGARERLILGLDEAILTTAFPAHYVARAVVRAANDWTADRWLSLDSRLYSLILVSNALPEQAVQEIRRMGANERMVGVAMGVNALGKPFGDPIYHPIYAAASELGLPVVLQVGSDNAGTLITPPLAGGLPGTFGEYRALSAQPLMSHVASLILQAVFEVYPGLRIVLLGGGATWVPAFLWRLNYIFQLNRHDAPWLRKPPSEYFREHVRVSTYSLETAPGPERLGRALGALPWFDSVLMYASGYPNSDWEQPAAVAERLPAAWHKRVFRENALDTFRWPDRAARPQRAGIQPDRLLEPRE